MGTIQHVGSRLDEHLGYEKYEHAYSGNSRNGSKPKTLSSQYGEIPISVPQDRNSELNQR